MTKRPKTNGLEFHPKIQSRTNGILVNQVDTSSSILSKWIVFGRYRWNKNNPSKTHGGIGLWLAINQNLAKWENQRRGDSRVKSWLELEAGSSRAKGQVSRVKYQGLHWFWAGNGANPGFELGMGLRHDRWAHFNESGQETIWQAMEDACHGEKTKAYDQRREAITQGWLGLKCQNLTWERSVSPSLISKQGRKRPWANEIVVAWLTLSGRESTDCRLWWIVPGPWECSMIICWKWIHFA